MSNVDGLIEELEAEIKELEIKLEERRKFLSQLHALKDSDASDPSGSRNRPGKGGLTFMIREKINAIPDGATTGEISQLVEQEGYQGKGKTPLHFQVASVLSRMARNGEIWRDEDGTYYPTSSPPNQRRLDKKEEMVPGAS